LDRIRVSAGEHEGYGEVEKEQTLRVRSSVPTIWSALRFRGKARVLQFARGFRDLRGGLRKCPSVAARAGDILLAESVSRLWRDGDSLTERALTMGKVQNLRLAARHINRAFVPAGSTFSFWKQVGRATRRGGYVDGRELREGCVIPSVGGGLCQLSNALYDAALRAGFEIVERHAHSAVVAGSFAAAGRDATVFWNYVDLRFRPMQDVRVEVTIEADALAVRFWGSSASPRVASGTVPELPLETRMAPTGDCASCAVESCFRHIDPPDGRSAVGRTAFLVDAWWPEFDAYLSDVAQPHDVLFVPIDGRRRGVARYGWNTASVDDVRESLALAMMRGVQARRIARQGAARQRLLLRWAQRLAEGAAARLPYDVSHVVVAQQLLPTLWSGGHLGGRTYDVLMTGFPMRTLQATLDRAAALHPESPTLADFRAATDLVETEERALAGARAIVTPHAAIADLFGARAVRLAWATPGGDFASPRAKSLEPNIVFPASTLGRMGVYELREVSRKIDVRVVLTGPDLEGDRFWDGVRTERVPFETALRTASALVLPAFVENQPRRLLQALALGVPVVASDACGIEARAGIAIVPAGDVRALRAAVEDILRATVCA
jgi:hypothetical protein